MYLKVSTPAELEKFVDAAAPGDICEYHSGDLSVDRLHCDDNGDPVGSIEVHRLALAVSRLQQRGLVRLVQRRRGESHFDYLAVRSEDAALAQAA